MTRALAIAAAVSLGCLVQQPAHAQELKQLQIARVSSRALFVPDPDKAYLLVESRNSRSLITFVKAADGTRDADTSNVDGYVEIPRENRFANEGDVSVWLYEVPPGEYFFSSINWQSLPVDTDCACMGSVRFSVDPGKVTAIRAETAILGERGEQVGIGNRPNAMPDGRKENDLYAMRGLVVGHPTSEFWREKLDEQFVEQARFTPVAELPNWFGHQINRVLPIAGVLDYDSDRMVDLRIPK